MPNKRKTIRKLRAILSADVKGYSLLMSDDEAFTIKTLKKYRSIMTEQIEEHEGRVVDAPGDNLLAEFSSAVDAVECAVKIQKYLKRENDRFAEDKKLQYRIGVNIGDVVQDGDRIYGSGVNVAARIESLSEPGGVCVSRNAYDHIKDKLSFGYEYLGDHEVKNIKDPVRVYKVLTDPEDAGKLVGEKIQRYQKKWPALAVAIVAILIGIIVWQFYYQNTPPIEAASVENMAFPLPDKPSIAVLPFDNMSGDPDQDYFCDGLTDQIISTLSKYSGLFVIARNSTFIYKGKPVKIKKIAEDLGVKYVLEGSVQRTVDRIRVRVQLIDAITGFHVLSERYDKELKDIFDIQDDITMKVGNALEIQLLSGEQARIWSKAYTTNFEAFEKTLKGRHYFNKATNEDNMRSRALFNEAMDLDPGNVVPYLMLGWTYFNEGRQGWVESPYESIKMAYEYAQKAIKTNDRVDGPYALLGVIYGVKHQHEKGVEQLKHALTINPNSSDNYSFLAGLTGVMGKWEESVGYSKTSIRLSPNPPTWYYWILGRAYFMTDQYNNAIETLKKAVYVNPNFLLAHTLLAACFSSLGHQADAAAEAEEVLRINPNFTLESYAKTLPYKNKADIERYIDALRKAGLT
ncbi:MAG: hypothetical protein HKO91_02675 [Desulfobacterales bacterium]|nr:hypothetical protein [Desulfobacterales bacterium]